MNKQELAAKIWATANKMRSKIEASEYKDYILGFIFYKFLSEKETKYLFSEGWSKDDLTQLDESKEEVVEYVSKNIGYFISYDNLFTTWLNNKDFTVENVKDAISAFNRLIHPKFKRVFEKIFQTLDTGLSKLGDNSGAQTKAIRGLIDLIKDIPMDDKQDYDVLGFIYEYLISNFAANAGKKAGEFYTPHEVSLLMSEIVANHLKDRKNIKIYDPTSGSGSLLINIGKCVAKHLGNSNSIKYYAQELKENTYNLTRMNLVMRGILPNNIITRCADTLADDWPYFDNDSSYNLETVDAVVSNPPYSQPWDPTGHEDDIRYARFGLAPKSKADYAFLLHDLYHVKENGIMTIVLPHGVLFRGGEEEKIRRQLIEYNHIDTIIGLPANIFFGTGIPTIIMVLKQKRANDDVLIIDASKHFIKSGKNNILRSSDIKKILDVVISRKTTDKFSKIVTKQEIRNNDYNLNIPRYVDSSEKTESYDLYATMFGGIPKKEINELNKYFTVFPSLKNELFTDINDNYSKLNDEDVNEIIKKNIDVNNFINTYNKTMNTFSDYLKEQLIDNLMNVDIRNEELVIANELFNRLAFSQIIDKYKAYQLLDDEYKIISQDLEIIHTEGTQVIKHVKPNMIIKKKDSKEIEVQDGWLGYILPFELVQKQMLLNECDKIEKCNNELINITSEYEEILESISEDDKESIKELINDDDNTFVGKEINKYVKTFLKNNANYDLDSIEYKMINVNSLMEKEKELKKQCKDLEASLHLLTKVTIEKLTDKQALDLLSIKWIQPITEFIHEMPSKIIKNFVSKIVQLSKKYETTMLDLSNDIITTEKELSKMLDELTGSEYDMKGIEKLKKLLNGDENE